jgi:hypothetical protein
MCKECGCSQDQNCSCGEAQGRCGCGCDCGCGGHGARPFERRFQTKAERIAGLESYLGELKTEVQAVEEHLADLRK